MTNSDMAERDLDELLYDFVKELADSNFPSPKYIETQSANIYYKSLEDGREYMVKEFFKRDLFETELRAFANLGDTGRTCQIVFDSTQLPAYWRPGFKGPYFILKPYLKDILRPDKTIYRLLDFAAQEADISDLLLQAGWRDFDGNFENDAIDVSGRLIRFDLDGAQPCWPPLRKFEPAFHVPHESQVRERIQEAFDELAAEQMEVTSLALRLSRLLLNNMMIPWKLANDISSDQPASKSHGSKHKEGPTFFDRYVFSLLPGKGSILSLKLTDREGRRLRDQWLKSWLDTLAGREGQPRPLNSTEVRLLGSLLYHLLKGGEPRFLIKDVYYSLLLFSASTLIKRTETAGMEKVKSRLNELAELKHFISLSFAGDSGSTQTHVVSSKTAPTLELHQSSAGGQWATSKLQDWQCQDLVLDYSNSKLPMMILADGASGANGLEAVKMVQAVFDQAVKEMPAVDSLDRAKDFLIRLISDAQRRLMLQGSEDGKSYETTLVIIALCLRARPHPVALLARFGNSEWLTTYQEPGGTIITYPNTRREPFPLGVRQTQFNPEKEIQTLSLNKPGTYRLRAVSDGIPQQSFEERNRIMGHESIVDLVADAAGWNKLPFIGDDDWSLAGFDIVAKEASQRPVPNVALAHTPSQIDWLEELFKLEGTRFPLSEQALKFWEQTIASDPKIRPLAEYPLIKDVVGEIQTEEPKAEEPKAEEPKAEEPKAEEKKAEDKKAEQKKAKQKKAVDKEQKARKKAAPKVRNADSEERKNKRSELIALVLFATVLVIVFVLFITFSSRGRVDVGNARQVNTSAQQENTSAENRNAPMTFKSGRQRQLYATLAEVKVYRLQELPKGSKLDSDLNLFIDELAEVLEKTGWEVNIEVHTDHIGDSRNNLVISEERAKAITDRLRSLNKVKESQFKTDGVGQSIPMVEHEVTAYDQGQNRRLEIRRVK